MFLTWLHIYRSERFYRVQCENSIASLHRIKKSMHRCFIARSLHVKGHIYAMRWRSDARFSWCDESTRMSVHTACDKTVFSTLSDLYVTVCSQVKKTCSMRAIIAAIVASRAATRQCEQIIKTYKVLFFSLVALSRRLTHRSLCERTFKILSHRERCVERCSNATNGKIRTLYISVMYSHCTSNAAVWKNHWNI